MGEHRVYDTSDEQCTRAFMRALLDDIRALDILIERDLIERDVQRVGVEQEMYLIDPRGDATSISDKVLARGVPSRVGFGDRWVQDSLVEIFRDNASRYHVIMIRDVDANPLQQIEQGIVPELPALSLHNGTVWCWNRPCYGITEGRPHLRIENRALPAGRAHGSRRGRQRRPVLRPDGAARPGVRRCLQAAPLP